MSDSGLDSLLFKLLDIETLVVCGSGEDLFFSNDFCRSSSTDFFAEGSSVSEMFSGEYGEYIMWLS